MLATQVTENGKKKERIRFPYSLQRALSCEKDERTFVLASACEHTDVRDIEKMLPCIQRCMYIWTYVQYPSTPALPLVLLDTYCVSAREGTLPLSSFDANASVKMPPPFWDYWG